MMSRIRALALALLFSPFGLPAVDTSFTSDSHIHFNWDQAEAIRAEKVVAILQQAGIKRTIVSSTPSHLALQLRQTGGDWIIPFFSPYTHPMGKRDWFLDQQVITQAQQGLKQGKYYGIGEVHFMSGFKPSPDNKIFVQLMQLAQKYQVPVLIHVDSSNEQYFVKICQRYPNIRILFAHAGGNLLPNHIEITLQQCPNIWIDLSARDPWRYGKLTQANGLLLPAWESLILKYPTRFIIGTDPVWKVTRTQSWDQHDDGWDHYQKLFQFHQGWLQQLPQQVQQLIGTDNLKRVLSDS